jgi:hypothetical protein
MVTFKRKQKMSSIVIATALPTNSHNYTALPNHLGRYVPKASKRPQRVPVRELLESAQTFLWKKEEIRVDAIFYDLRVGRCKLAGVE